MAEKLAVKPPATARLVMPVSGLHCASCVAKVERTVSELRGVRSVSVDLAGRLVVVEYEPRRDLGARQLRQAVERLGYQVLGQGESMAQVQQLSDEALEREQGRLTLRLQVSAFLSIFLLAGGWMKLSPYTVFLLAIPLQIWGGWHFHKGLYHSLLRRSADMNTLVSLSTWASFLYSAYVTFLPETVPAAARQTQWDAVAGLITLITFGRWLESKTRGKTHEAVMRLMRIAPKTVRALRGGEERTLALSEVSVGEIIRVHPGEQVGLDGLVESGSTTIDESLLTGESLPVEKSPGSHVWGGTINKTGSIDVKVMRPGSESALARIVEAVRAAQASKPRIQKFADRVAAAFVPAVILIGTATALLWALYGPEPKVMLALSALVSVFAVACPCALGLATPLAIIAGMGRAAEMGVFIRNAEMLEDIGDVDVVVFDKTGTLTFGKPQVVEALPAKGSLAQLLSYAMAAEERSEHPFAAAVLAFARAAGAKPAPVEFFEAFPGRGVLIRSGGRLVRTGSLAWLKGEGVDIPPETDHPRRPGSFLGVAVDSDFLGAFVLEDTIRPTAKEAVRRLTRMGLEVILVSGDRHEIAYRLAEQAGIDRVFAGVLPEEKARIVERLQSEGKTVAMVGEGFNDAPALSHADVGIALATGTDIAIEAADMTVMNPDLTMLATGIQLSQRIRRVIWQNLFWAFAYNVVLIPVAAGALYPHFGIWLKPMYAGAAMALSSISVALNSFRLRRYDGKEE
ncbi:MAG: copper-translocating P-type ATPase [Elusimicrobia bacterium]|nr:copper-translocating P-type ATPase [Elusimicrobiota bacterium]